MALDLSKVPLKPPDLSTLPVGGRLGHFHLNWKFLAALPSVINTLEFGLKLQFQFLCPGASYQQPLFFPREECCTLPSSLRHVAQRSNSGGWRPVIDLSFLNLCLDFPTFRMETTQSIRNSLQVGQWTTSLDLKHAYFHIPMTHSVHKLLKFQVLAELYQFVAMPFGLATAPREFTTLVKEVRKMALRLGVSVHMYLDDWLIKANSCQEAHSATLTMLELTRKLGWIVNREKSDLLPKQVFTFLGQVFDLSKGVCYPTEARFMSIQKAIHPLLHNTFTTPRQVAPFRFTSSSGSSAHETSSVSSQETLQLQPERCPGFSILLKPFREGSSKVVVTQEQCHGKSSSSPTQVTFYTDASVQGWGAHCAHMITQGLWSIQQSKLHINVLELKAVLLALKTFVPQLPIQLRIIQVASDNTTVCAYINKQGGTRSWDMFVLSWHLFAFCQKNKVVLSARHVPGVMNLVADQLSRSEQILHTEWSLNPQIFRWLSLIDFHPQIDLFATRFNHKLPLYVSPVPDPQALAVDALEMNWSGLLLYSFPPTALCPVVVKKFMNSQSCRMLLVAPFWETKEWLQDLLALSIRKPVALPLKRNLLKQPHLEVCHQNRRSLNLHAFWLKSP